MRSWSLRLAPSERWLRVSDVDLFRYEDSDDEDEGEEEEGEGEEAEEEDEVEVVEEEKEEGEDNNVPKLPGFRWSWLRSTSCSYYREKIEID